MMKSTFLLITVFTVYFYQKGLARSSPLQVINGEDAADGEFPYMVEVRSSTNCLICGGTIIGSKWILTAGHCIDENSLGEYGGYSVVYNTTTLHDCRNSLDDPTTIIKVKAQHRHTNYSLNFISGLSSYDVGLLELEEEIPFSVNAQPIRLAENDDIPAEGGVEGILSGWGSNITNGYPMVNLQKVNLTALPNEECSERIDHVADGDMVYFDSNGFFCTDDPNKGQCAGDSGSPFVIDGIQYGIVSWSIRHCGEFPGVYVRVGLPEHREWIRNVSGI